jgi:hypothetical protein
MTDEYTAGIGSMSKHGSFNRFGSKDFRGTTNKIQGSKVGLSSNGDISPSVHLPKDHSQLLQLRQTDSIKFI